MKVPYVWTSNLALIISQKILVNFPKQSVQSLCQNIFVIYIPNCAMHQVSMFHKKAVDFDTFLLASLYWNFKIIAFGVDMLNNSLIPIFI